MEWSTDRIQYLWERYLERSASQEELGELTRWLEHEADSDRLQKVLEPLLVGQAEHFRSSASLKDYAGRKIKERIVLSSTPPVPSGVHRIPLWRRWWVAASVLLALGVGIYTWTMDRNISNPPVAVAAEPINVEPGRVGAVLTLADGSQMVLDSQGKNEIVNQKGVRLLIRDGRLAYNLTGEAVAGLAYNTITTPKGRQFQVSLPDGTKVWLNAASSLRYPTAFTGKERKVEVSGEAYFEVAKNAGMPFRVNVNDEAEIEVLGTHFNVNAYKNEQTLNTTLLEGSVKVLKGSLHAILTPGQQAQVAAARKEGPADRETGKGPEVPGMRIVKDADVNKVMAWKNGLFNFEGVMLEEVMRQLERWYDIEVVYEGKPPLIRFVGELGKNISLKELLEILEKTQVHFRLEKGRRLVVTG